MKPDLSSFSLNLFFWCIHFLFSGSLFSEEIDLHKRILMSTESDLIKIDSNQAEDF